MEQAILKDEFTGKEDLVTRSQLLDPDGVDIGDNDAVKVEILNKARPVITLSFVSLYSYIF